MCELLPHLSSVADDLCIVNSFHTNAINHDPAKTFICTGFGDPGSGQHGRLAQLRTWIDESGLAGFRRAHFRLLDRRHTQCPGAVQPTLGQRSAAFEDIRA